MMTKDQLISVLDHCNINYSFELFDRPQNPPYILVSEEDTQNISSDSDTFEIVNHWEIELYYRDPQDRHDFDQRLLSQHVAWERTGTDTWIDSERIYMSRYWI